MATEAARLEINVTAPGADDTAKKLASVDKEVGGLADSVKKFVTAAGIMMAIKAVGDFAGASVVAFGTAQASALRLSKAMELRGIDGGADRFSKLAGEMQTMTGVSDEVVKDLAARMVMEGKSEEMTRKLIKAAADLSAVTGDSLETSVRKLNGTLSGMAGQLGRTNPEIAAMTKEQLLAGGAIDLVAQKYAGMAESMARTVDVSNKLKDETLGDLTEMIGEFFAPSVMAANDAVIGFATVGMEALKVINAMPEPLKLVITATGLFAGAITALAVANSMGLTIMVKKTVVEAVAIAKTVAHTVAKWAAVVAQWALNVAMAVANASMWAQIAVGVALTAAIVGVAIATANTTQVMDKQATQTRLNIGLLGKYRQEFEAWRQSQGAGDAEWIKSTANAREYANAIAESSQAMRKTTALENAGILTREESLKAQLEIQKKNLEVTIARARAEGNPAIMARNVAEYRAKIDELEQSLAKLNEKPKDHESNWRSTLDSLDQRYEASAEHFMNLEDRKAQEVRDQFGQTMARLNSGFDEYGEVIEDNHSGWLESIEEIRSAYQNVFSSIAQGFSAIGTIIDNVGKQQIMRIDDEMKKRQEAGTLTIEMEKQYEDQKKKIERNAAIRAKALAMFQAALNIPLMIMEGYKAGNIPGAIVGGVIGATQLAAASSTPIPSAQFGGEFIVPPGYQGDSGLLRVNSGERVSVDPVRKSDDGPKSMVVQIGQREFEAYLQETLNSGRVTIRRQGVVRYA